MSRASARSPKRQPSSGSNCSSWTTAGSASATTTTPGLGDWTVNPKKFPNGLKPLAEYVHSLNMDFGLWVEPEMVNPDSDLYRAHPDWAMHFPGRPRSELRNQLVLNLARQDVKEYILGVLDKLVTDYPIKYLKWDMNRSFSEPGWEGAPDGAQKEIWIQYVRNLYEIIDRLRAKHPGLEIESCSGGGGRIDLGIMRHVDEVWTSDNTEAFDRLTIQEGFSQAYAPQTMSAWVTDVPEHERPQRPAEVPFPGCHARRTWHRREPQQMDA